MREISRGEEFYDGTALLGDPIHGYITFTTPRPSFPERTDWRFLRLLSEIL